MKTSSLLLCLFLSCFLQAQWDTSRIILQGKHMVIISHPDSAVRYAFAFGEEGTLKAEGRYAQNDTSKVGWWTTYHSNGKRESIGKYKAGKKVGYWKHFHTNGEIESAGWYEEGRSYGW